MSSCDMVASSAASSYSAVLSAAPSQSRRARTVARAL